MYVVKINQEEVKRFTWKEFNEFVMNMQPWELKDLKNRIVSYPN